MSERKPDVRRALMRAGLRTFCREGYESSTTEQIRSAANVSNGSFFHFFPTKRALAAAVYIDALRNYHQHLLKPLKQQPSAATGISQLIAGHLDWVTSHRSQAFFLFDQTRADWLGDIRPEQGAANLELRTELEAWRAQLVARRQLRPLPAELFFSQLIGPAQIFCRAWLSGRSRTNPKMQQDSLVDCALRALLPQSALRQSKWRGT